MLNSQWDRHTPTTNLLRMIGILCQHRLTVKQVAKKMGWPDSRGRAGEKRARRGIASLETMGAPIQCEEAEADQYDGGNAIPMRYWLDPKWVAEFFNLGRAFHPPGRVAERTVLAQPSRPAEERRNGTFH